MRGGCGHLGSLEPGSGGRWCSCPCCPDSDPWVKEAADDVHSKRGEDEGQDGKHHDPLEDGVVTLGHGIDRQRTQAGKSEYVLDRDDSAQEAAHDKPNEIEGWKQGVGERVLSDHSGPK